MIKDVAKKLKQFKTYFNKNKDLKMTSKSWSIKKNV